MTNGGAKGGGNDGGGVMKMGNEIALIMVLVDQTWNSCENSSRAWRVFLRFSSLRKINT